MVFHAFRFIFKTNFLIFLRKDNLIIKNGYNILRFKTSFPNLKIWKKIWSKLKFLSIKIFENLEKKKFYI